MFEERTRAGHCTHLGHLELSDVVVVVVMLLVDCKQPAARPRRRRRRRRGALVDRSRGRRRRLAEVVRSASAVGAVGGAQKVAGDAGRRRAWPAHRTLVILGAGAAVVAVAIEGI